MWTDYTETSCGGTTARIYCFGTDFNQPLNIVAAPGRKAFVSSGSWFAQMGVAAADTQCQNDANAAALGGTYAALLATTSASALSRFNTSGSPWVRVDGIPIVASATDLATVGTALIAPLNVTASGVYLGNWGAWTGANSPTVVGTNADTCNNSTSNCNAGNAIYCLQQ